jgi:hypothetical protein
MALFRWGIGFYGPGIYSVSLKARHRWSTSLMSSATTASDLLRETVIIFMAEACACFGPRRVVFLGNAAMGAGVAGLTIITDPWQLDATLLVMSGSWVSMRGAAITIISVGNIQVDVAVALFSTSAVTRCLK